MEIEVENTFKTPNERRIPVLQKGNIFKRKNKTSDALGKQVSYWVCNSTRKAIPSDKHSNNKKFHPQNQCEYIS